MSGHEHQISLDLKRTVFLEPPMFLVPVNKRKSFQISPNGLKHSWRHPRVVLFDHVFHRTDSGDIQLDYLGPRCLLPNLR